MAIDFSDIKIMHELGQVMLNVIVKYRWDITNLRFSSNVSEMVEYRHIVTMDANNSTCCIGLLMDVWTCCSTVVFSGVVNACVKRIKRVVCVMFILFR